MFCANISSLSLCCNDTSLGRGGTGGKSGNFRPLSVRSVAWASSDEGSDASEPIGEKPRLIEEGAKRDTSVDSTCL